MKTGNSKYQNWYNSIIQNSQIRLLNSGIYTEKHHIIPKSLGGINSKGNIVRLTPREHYICHLLLVELTTGNDQKKILWAAYSMMHTRNCKVNSKLYEKYKLEYSKMMKGNKNGSGNKGNKHSIETIQKRANSNRGQKRSIETKLNISKALTGRHYTRRPMSSVTKAKLSIAHTGKIVSLETREKMRKRMLGSIPWNKGTKGVIVAWNKGKKLTPEQLINHSLHLKGKPWSEARRLAQQNRNKVSDP